MTEPTTEAGRRLLAYFRNATNGTHYPATSIAAIETEAAKREGDHWRRMPGTYRLPDGGVEVIVDVPESASFLVDEFPDEVRAIQAEAAAAALAALRVEVERLETVPWWERDPDVHPDMPDGAFIDRAAVLAAIGATEADAGEERDE